MSVISKMMVNGHSLDSKSYVYTLHNLEQDGCFSAADLNPHLIKTDFEIYFSIYMWLGTSHHVSPQILHRNGHSSQTPKTLAHY